VRKKVIGGEDERGNLVGEKKEEGSGKTAMVNADQGWRCSQRENDEREAA